MEHPHEKILHAYVDKTLDRQREEDLGAHLAKCPRCRREVSELALLFDELKHLPAPRPDRGMVTRILLARECVEREHPVSLDLFSLLFGRIGWAVVAVGLLAGGILGYSSLEPQGSFKPGPEASYTLATQEDPFLGYLISDNGDIL